VAIARQHTDRVVVREWPGYIAQKNYAASLAAHDWILSLDADERVTPELAAEIQTCLKAAPREAAFQIPRVTWHLGRWIRSTDWYPDYQMRLYDRRSAEWTGRYVHEAVTVRGAAGRLRGEMQHYAYATSPTTRDHQSLHDAGGAADARGRAACRLFFSWPAIRRWRSCATTRHARHRRRPSGLHHLGA
jgi:glycosyltransferase involved in cell wall biosynthesis